MAQEIGGMELYKRTLDGLMAFTLTQLEGAAVGVKEVEEKRSKEFAAAWKRLEEMQANLHLRAASWDASCGRCLSAYK